MTGSVPLLQDGSLFWQYETIQDFSELKRKVHAIHLAHKHSGFPLAKSQRESMKTISKNKKNRSLIFDRTIYISPEGKLFVIVEKLFSEPSLGKSYSKMISIDSGKEKMLQRWNLRYIEKDKGPHLYERFAKIFSKESGFLKIDNNCFYQGLKEGDRKPYAKQMVISNFYKEVEVPIKDQKRVLDHFLSIASGLLKMHAKEVVYIQLSLKDIFYEKRGEDFLAVHGNFGAFRYLAKEQKLLQQKKVENVWDLGIIFSKFLNIDGLQAKINAVMMHKERFMMTKDELDRIHLNVSTVELRSILDMQMDPLFQLTSQMLNLDVLVRPSIITVYNRLKEISAFKEKTISCCKIL